MPPLRLPDGQRLALEAAYATPQRTYHDYGHVRSVLRHYDDVAADAGWKQPVEVYLAVLYHDSIYEAGRSDNEERSAQLARDHIAQWLPDAGIDAGRVAFLVALTAGHGQLVASDLDDDAHPEDARRFLDCDMAILGALAAEFDAYDRGIAAEYRGRVPGWRFKRNRRRFLRALLGRERIFLSDYFHDRLDAAARTNLHRTLEGDP